MDFTTNGSTTPNGLNGVNGHSASQSTPQPLAITICGAGIGGLSAAIFLRQQGHTVTLLEASRFANELGAAVHLAPNANGLLRRIGLIPEAHGAVNCRRMTQLFPNGKQMFSVDLELGAGRWQHPWQLAHRVSLHSELKRLATCAEGPGTPAVLKLRSKVVDVDAKQGVVILENGERIESDVVVGADGVHSKTRARLPGAEKVKVFGSGKSAFRFLIPRQKAYDEPETRKFADQEGHLIMIFARDRRVVVYPTSDNTLLNFVCIHPTAESQINPEEPGSSDWQNSGNLSKMLEVYKEFEPAVLKLLSMADEETLKVWELLDMDKLPTWTHDKLVLIGDAAHPFTPHQGQGAAQAIEDAASLAVMLGKGTSPSTIPARLQLYQKCRYDRASIIQEYSRIAGKDLGSGPPIDTTKFTNYNFGYDEWDHSRQVLREWEWETSLQKNSAAGGKGSLYWRMPTSFGPMPGPRQDHFGNARNGSKATFTTASIKFKTSRTVLENLLPSQKLKFAVADTTAYATFSATQLGNLEWLGGKGYTHFGLYIHGIAYTKEDGENVVGSYLPVLFENLADPILSGREELGFPKLFADLNVEQTENGEWKLEASWMGEKFCSVVLEGLQQQQIENGSLNGNTDINNGAETPAAAAAAPPQSQQQQQRDDGLLLHKYMPTTSSPTSASNQPDAEYTTFLSHATDAKTVERVVESSVVANKASVSFDKKDWKALPTLHHVVERLAEIPVYGVVEAKVVRGRGVSDVRGIERLA